MTNTNQIITQIQSIYQQYFDQLPTIVLPNDNLSSEENQQQTKDILTREQRDHFNQIHMITLARLKILNRQLHIQLDHNRKEYDTKRVTIEKLQLEYENLCYEKQHLDQKILDAQTLDTPNIQSIETELNQSIVSLTYQPDLTSSTEKNITLLEDEKQQRITLEANYQEKNSCLLDLQEQLNHKRKFLDEIPNKMQQFRQHLHSFQDELQQQMNKLSNNSTNNSSQLFASNKKPRRQSNQGRESLNGSILLDSSFTFTASST